MDTTPTVSATPLADTKPDVKDLFSAHDFDIQIDLPSSPQGTPILASTLIYCTIDLQPPTGSLYNNFVMCYG